MLLGAPRRHCAKRSRRLGGLRRRLADDPHSRRFPSRSGAGRERRRLHHRFRRRAGAAAGGAPRQGEPLCATSPGLLRSFDYAAATTLDPKNVAAARHPEGATRTPSSAACTTARPRPSSKPIAPRVARGAGLARRRAARPLSDRKGGLRGCVRGGQPAGVAADPDPRSGGNRSTCAGRRGRRHVMAQAAYKSMPTLDRNEIDALGHALHGDPFRVLGPHDTPDRPQHPRLRSGRNRRRGPAPRRPGRDRPARRDRARRAVRGTCLGSRALSAAHHLAGRHAGDRGPYTRSGRCSATSIFISSTKAATSSWRRRLAPMSMTVDGVQRRAFCGLGAECRPRRGGRRLQLLGFAAPSDAAAPSAPASGNCSCRGSATGTRYKYDIVGAGGIRVPLKADPLAKQAEAPPATASVVASPQPYHVARRGVDGRRAPSATRPTRRFRSTRCISAPGCGKLTRPARRCGTSPSTG